MDYKIVEKIEAPKNDAFLGEFKAVRIEQNGHSAWGFGLTFEEAEKDASDNIKKRN